MSTQLHSRRQFIRSFSFSAAALAAQPFLGRAAEPASGAAKHLFLLGDWAAVDPTAQQKVASAMISYKKQAQAQPSALFLLGDNFYGDLEGVDSPRWKTQFEEMYPKSEFDVPCYAILGNHDYKPQPPGKGETQLRYAATHPGTRWTLPSKWYRFDFPEVDPLVTFLMLDSNYNPPTPERPSLPPEERAAQGEWLRAELARPRKTKFLVVCGHHQLYSSASDNLPLIAEWDALFREHRAHLYFCGHIHDLEHLELEGHPTSFIVTGGGGATLRGGDAKRSSAQSHFGQNVHGFTHLEVHSDKLLVRHLSDTAQQLHAFSKTADGQVQIL